MTVPSDIAGAHPNVDAQVGKLRLYANALATEAYLHCTCDPPVRIHGPECPATVVGEAAASLAASAALARDAAEAKHADRHPFSTGLAAIEERDWLRGVCERYDAWMLRGVKELGWPHDDWQGKDPGHVLVEEAQRVAWERDEAFTERDKAIAAKPHVIGNPQALGHDYAECEPDCAACYFAAQATRLARRVAELERALAWERDTHPISHGEGCECPVCAVLAASTGSEGAAE